MYCSFLRFLKPEKEQNNPSCFARTTQQERKGLPVTEPREYTCYYVLASKGIQDYILRGDKLKLMIGGSEVVDRLPETLAGRLLISMGLSEGEDFLFLSRAAGGARILFARKEYAQRFSELLPPAFSLYAPGLDFVQFFSEIRGNLAETMDEAEKILAVRRNLAFPSYPVPGPPVERSPRSGLPSAGILRLSGGNREEADLSMLIKSTAAEEAKTGLAHKTLPEARGGKSYELPLSFEELTGEGNNDIAVVHIDGNGLGNVVSSLFKELKGHANPAERYGAFCGAVQDATELSLREALAPVIEAHEKEASPGSPLPFRPLVCAGDDVTVVLRAEYAVQFAADYFLSFEKHSEDKLSSIGIHSLEEHLPLTACAGIAFVKKTFPFSQAYELCESLCRFAKDRTKRKCSALAFWRLTSGKGEDFYAILERELTITHSVKEESTTVLTMMPYSAGTRATGPTVDQLLNLRDAVKSMPRGGLRSLLSELFTGKEAAVQSFKRYLDVNRTEREVSRPGGAKKLEKLLSALEALTGNTEGNALFAENATPLYDAVELISAERSS